MRRSPPPLFALMVATAGGCIIPVAPQFEDAEPNYPPFLVSSTPGEGDIFTQGEEERAIAVTLGDHNLRDDLSVRFLIDYPGGDMSPSHKIFELIVPPSGTAVRQTVRIQPSCSLLQLTPGPHRLTMAAADRPYLDALAGDSVPPEAPLDSPKDGNAIRVVWLLNCP
jgi:hypothetical protein